MTPELQRILFPKDEERLAGRLRKAYATARKKAGSVVDGWLASTIAARWPGK